MDERGVGGGVILEYAECVLDVLCSLPWPFHWNFGYSATLVFDRIKIPDCLEHGNFL